MTNEVLSDLEKRAWQIRRDVIDVLDHSTGGHYGGALSSAELLSALFFHIMRIDADNPYWDERDRFVLSKGHISVAYCATLARKEFFAYNDLHDTYAKLDSPYSMHPIMEEIRGCDMSTGSLGHGLPIGVGMAIAGKLDKKPYRVFVLIGDADLQEGSTWEAANSASHYKLDNLICIVDRNRISMDGPTEDLMSVEPVASKWEAFNWIVKEVDGHNLKEILPVLESVPFTSNHPSLIVANTIKGKGVSFLENKHQSHFIKFSDEQTEQAFKELDEQKPE